MVLNIMDVSYQSPKQLNKEYYDSIMDPDGITKEWILAENMPIMICITALYLLVVLKIGPSFMKAREPYTLKTVMRIYNLIQVLGNGYIIFKGVKDGHLGCVLRSYCKIEENIKDCERSFLPYLQVSWFFMVLKILDLLDTVFMVLRKKMSHVTFLHVYHHAAMVVSTWVSFHYFKTPQSAGVAILNVFVHTVMYGYYFLATFPSLKKFLWWKRHLTKIQLGQFAVILTYLSYLYYNQCEIAPAFTFLWMFNTTLVCALFINFYVKTYILGKNKSN